MLHGNPFGNGCDRYQLEKNSAYMTSEKFLTLLVKNWGVAV